MKRPALSPASLSLQTLLAAAALVGSCYDTPLIEGDQTTAREAAAGEGGAISAAGSAGHGGAGKPSGGVPSGAGGRASAGAGGSPATSGESSLGGDTTGVTAGQAGEPSLPPRVSWLSLAGDEAPATLEPNRELGIHGTFYAYSDSCAEVAWEAQTRCVSGRLCDPNVEPDAWGVAIGFNFRTTGSSDTPPDSTLLWNPDDMKAQGVSWRVTGKAPGLQVWVLNMDPSWQGECAAQSCDIEGPPDGVDVAALQGELLFAQMLKDYWGGVGVDYDYDPARVHALQFKLPAIRVHAATFDFCLDALGIIR